MIVQAFRRFGAFTAAAAMASAMPVVAHAQQSDAKTGSRFKEDRFSGQEERARIALGRFGECVSRIKRDEFPVFMADRSAENWKAVMYFPNNQTRCAFENMQISTRSAQGAVAEGWYLAQYQEGMPPALANYAPRLPSLAPAIARITAADKGDKPTAIVDEFARCGVSSAPTKVDAFLRSEVVSKQEAAAFAELSPELGPCAFEGQKLSFNMMGFRGAVAMAMVELALNPSMHDADEG